MRWEASGGVVVGVLVGVVVVVVVVGVLDGVVVVDHVVLGVVEEVV